MHCAILASPGRTTFVGWRGGGGRRGMRRARSGLVWSVPEDCWGRVGGCGGRRILGGSSSRIRSAFES